jgi:hypothetical protein
MGRQARIKRERAEQRRAAEASRQAEASRRGETIAVNKWNDLPTPTGSGANYYVKSRGMVFTDYSTRSRTTDNDGITSDGDNTPEGAWVPASFAASSTVDDWTQAPPRTASSEEHPQHRPPRQNPRLQMALMMAQGLMMLTDTPPRLPRHRAPNHPRHDGRFTPKRPR